MTDAPKFTPQQWRMALDDLLLNTTPDYFGDDGEWHSLKVKNVAAYALTLLDEKERAERERDEAYEAMLNLDPAVRRSLERKGNG